MAATQKPKTTDKHPYMSGMVGLMQLAAHFRKSFPTPVSADTLKKLAIAPNNESYLLNILRFVGILDADGNKSATASAVFNQHEDADFQEGFGKLVKAAYADLFSLHGDDAWSLPTNKLISFFRNSDQTSAIVGQRQASTFQALAVLSGKLDGNATKVISAPPNHAKAAKKATSDQSKKPPVVAVKSKAHARSSTASIPNSGNGSSSDVGLTVRIEINLPASGDQETYDHIFKSIRENLLNAKTS
ncbi:MAG TPA: DUF5343 domain-containing protein [Rhodanobacter sp.]|jgi:hypothetical protein|nr:DUF5343 domain-containing protein [Rhodanobacter sp.]